METLDETRGASFVEKSRAKNSGTSVRKSSRSRRESCSREETGQRASAYAYLTRVPVTRRGAKFNGARENLPREVFARGKFKGSQRATARGDAARPFLRPSRLDVFSSKGEQIRGLASPEVYPDFQNRRVTPRDTRTREIVPERNGPRNLRPDLSPSFSNASRRSGFSSVRRSNVNADTEEEFSKRFLIALRSLVERTHLSGTPAGGSVASRCSLRKKTIR